MTCSSEPLRTPIVLVSPLSPSITSWSPVDAPAEALEALATFSGRSMRVSSVNFPVGYVKRADGIKPMASHLFRDNELRLKLHMTLVMRATKAPHTLTKYTTRYLARLLNLPVDTGHRRVNDALKWLKSEQLVIDVALTDGKPGWQLLKPDGSGDPWEVNESRWVGVPFALWSNGWILALSGRELAVLLALLERNGGSKEPDGEMLGGYRKPQYGLSDDTWTRATQKLEELGLLKITTVKWGNEEFERRIRKRYRIAKKTLSEQPDWSLV